LAETDCSRLALRVSLRFHGDAKGPGGALRGAHTSPVPALGLVERLKSITLKMHGRLSRFRPHRPVSGMFRTFRNGGVFPFEGCFAPKPVSGCLRDVSHLKCCPQMAQMYTFLENCQVKRLVYSDRGEWRSSSSSSSSESESV
jgi:hypothetical protein